MTTDLELIQQNSMHILGMSNPSVELCFEAVKRDLGILQYIYNWHYPELALMAVKYDGFALMFIEQNKELRMEAIKQNGLSLEFAHCQSVELCLEAIKQNHNSYQFVMDIVRNEIVLITIKNVCIGLKQLNLPSYILMDIIDIVLMQHNATHFCKINRVIQLNEQKN